MCLDERDDPLGQLGPADDQVGEVDVVLVVDERAAVDAAGEQPGGGSDRDRRGGVPLVLATRVHVGVGEVTDDRHHLHAGRAHRHHLGVELLGEAGRERRRAAARDRDPEALRRPRGYDGRLAGVERLADHGLGHRAGGELAGVRVRCAPRARRARPSRRAAARRTRACRRAGRRSRPGPPRGGPCRPCPPRSARHRRAGARRAAPSAARGRRGRRRPSARGPRGPRRAPSAAGLRRRRPARPRARGRPWRFTSVTRVNLSRLKS